VSVTVTTQQGQVYDYQEVDDLFLAGAEVPVPDPRLPPGTPPPPPANQYAFLLDAEAGQITFGDGAHGARPPELAIVRADYDYSVGSLGNVGVSTINTSPVLPQGFSVDNPIRTWGGADAETASDGEKQISRYLQHRDRLVTAYDFTAITLRTPGVQIGRVEVLPNFHPDLSSGSGGDAAGVITLMLIPEYDPVNPKAPSPANDFLNTVCAYLDTRRLITSEIFLRGPEYVGIWISIGIQVLPGASAGPVYNAVKAQIQSFLAPTAGGVQQLPDDPSTLFNAPQTQAANGWPLGKSVIALEIMAQAGRVAGVDYVQPVLLAQNGAAAAQIDIEGLQLPQILGISVVGGDPIGIDALRGNVAAPSTGAAAGPAAQVPVIPQECN
jgi:predicted phage baseplate assembly protein